MVEFAGHDMPVQYFRILVEYNNCRENAGVFQVSHISHIRIDEKIE